MANVDALDMPDVLEEYAAFEAAENVDDGHDELAGLDNTRDCGGNLASTRDRSPSHSSDVQPSKLIEVRFGHNKDWELGGVERFWSRVYVSSEHYLNEIANL